MVSRLSLWLGLAMMVSVPQVVQAQGFGDVAQTVVEQAAEAERLDQEAFELYRTSHWAGALEKWKAALEIYRRTGAQGNIARTLNNISLIYQLQGSYAKALETYQQSLALAQELGDRPGIAITLNNIGIIYGKQGSYEQALETYQQSLALSQELGDRSVIARTLNNIGIVYALQGSYEQALKTYQQSLAIFQELGDHPGIVSTLGNIGNIYRLQGFYAQALETYQQSLAIKQELGDHSGIAITLGNIGIIHGKQGSYEQALGTFQQSLAIKQELGDRPGTAQTLNNIGIIYEKQGSYAQALETYQQSLALLQELGDRPGIATTLHNIGTFLQAQNQPELAIIFLKQSVNTYETIRADSRGLPQDLQESYLTTIEDTYRTLADLLIQQERILEAQRVLDLLKIQELDDYLSGVRGSRDSQAGVALQQPERTIDQAYTQLLETAIAHNQQRTTLEAKASQGIALTTAEHRQLQILQAEQDQLYAFFQDFIESDAVQTALDQLSRPELRQNLPLEDLGSLPDNLKNLQQDAVLLYPFILHDRLELILLTPNGPPIHRPVAISPAEIADAVGAFRSALENPSLDAQTPAQQLYDWLIAPIENDLQAAGAQTIIYAPDRTLRYIPLAALHDGNQWLAERFRVNNITAASLTDLNSQPHHEPRILAGAFAEGEHVITVGEQQFPFAGLPYAGQEVAQIGQLTRKLTTLLNGDFSPPAVRTNANQHTILHLATHAQFLVGEPNDSFIVFGDGAHVTLRDLKRGWLNSLTNVDLVVLSACETGVDNTFQDGAEILGFGYLMQQAGARASMASLWAVDDSGTQVLMSQFYDALIRGNLSKTAALQQAQLQLINAGEAGARGGLMIADRDLDPAALSHPHYWAPFVLVGNGL